MRLSHVTSSMISTLGYDPNQEIMVVQFQNGKTYRYNGVPTGVFLAVLTDRESVGKAFNHHIRSKSYPYKEIELSDVEAL